MPYKFPDRYPRQNDSIDIGELNKHFLDMAEALSADVGEHNIEELSGSNSYTFADTARYRILHTQQPEELGFGAPTGSPAKHTKPPLATSGYAANAFLLPNSGQWETIISFSASTNNKNFRVLHVMAHACYNWTGYETGGGHAYSHKTDWAELTTSPTDQPWGSPGFQLGLRINGRVTVYTGNRNEQSRPHIPLRPYPELQNIYLPNTYQSDNPSFTTAAGDYPSLLNLRSEVTSCPGQTTMALDLVDIVPVPPGVTEIELVGRRLTDIEGIRVDSDDVIAFLNRHLIAFIYEDNRVRDRATTATGIVPIRKGDAATTTQLNTNKLQKLKTAVDSIEGDSVKKFNRYHMDKPFKRSSDNVMIVLAGNVDYTSGITIQNRLPGETTSLFRPVGTYTGGTGWTPLTTTAGGTTEFLVRPAAPTKYPNSTEDGFIHLTGHIHIQSIKKAFSGQNPQPVNTRDEYHMASVALYYLIGTTRILVPASVVNVSRTTVPNPENTYEDLATLTVNGNMHVPLAGIISDPTSIATDIDGFGICVSTINWQNADVVEVVVINASLNVEYYIQ